MTEELTLPGVAIDAPVEKTESQKRMDAERLMLESEASKIEIERRAIAARHLCHDWSSGLIKHGVRHGVTMDDVNEYLNIPVMKRKSIYSTRLGQCLKGRCRN